MKLEDVLALRPAGATAAELVTAIDHAEELARGFARRAAELDRTRAASLLTAEDKAIAKAEQEASTARLAADRIEALLPLMRADLAAAEGRETREALRAEVPALVEAMAALQRWQVETYPLIAETIREGFRYQDAAMGGLRDWMARVDGAYARQEVRDAGPLDVSWAPEGAKPIDGAGGAIGRLPRDCFPFFS